jgi:ankyrin repeat protein
LDIAHEEVVIEGPTLTSSSSSSSSSSATAAVVAPEPKLATETPMLTPQEIKFVFDACMERDTWAVAKFLETHPRAAVTFVGMGYTPMHAAAAKDDFETMRLLLKAGFRANAVAESGITPLMLTRSFDCVLMLLARGANPNQESAEGACPMHAMDVDILRCLLAAGGNPNTTVPIHRGSGERDGTLVHYAANAYMSLNMLYVLLAARGNTEAVSLIEGVTPIHLACSHDNVEAIWALIAADADITKLTEGGQTSMELCTKADTKLQLRLGSTGVKIAAKRLVKEMQLLEAMRLQIKSFKL